MAGIGIERGDAIDLYVEFPPRGEPMSRPSALAQIIGSDPFETMHIPGEIGKTRIVRGMTLRGYLDVDFPKAQIPMPKDLQYTILDFGKPETSS